MKGQRSPKKSVAGKPKPARKKPNKERGIVLIDQGPIRERAASEFKQTMANLEEAKAEWKRFHEQDRPAFERWKSTAYGAILTRIRECEAELQEKTALIAEVEFEGFVGGHRNPRAAYSAVMERRNNPEKFDAYAKKQAEGEGKADVRDFVNDIFGDPDEEDFDEDDFEDELDDFELEFMFQEFVELTMGINPDKLSEKKYEELFAKFKESYRAEQERTRLSGERPFEHLFEDPGSAAEKHSAKDRVKEIYRILVRRLHPDLRADKDKSVSAIWHDVQEAYEQGNLERLEMLLALTELQNESASDQTSVSQIQAVVEELRRALSALRHTLQFAEHDYAWKFTLPVPTRLVRKLERDLMDELAAKERMLYEVRAVLEEWSKPVPRKKPKAGAKRPVKRPAKR